MYSLNKSAEKRKMQHVEWVIPQIPEGHPSPSVLLLLVLLFCLSLSLLVVVVDNKGSRRLLSLACLH